MQKTFLLSVLILWVLPSFAQPIPGAEQMDRWLPFTRDKKIALVVNQTSRVGSTHLVDTLLSLKVHVSVIFAPEHGFRGDQGAGEKVLSGKDMQTGLPITSLYGSHKKPTSSDLKDIDLVIFDIQDVGARFYTYISTMHYVMEACAEQHLPFLVLDRPNPNGHYVDGPILDTNYRSFVGMHPVPIVHGMTVGEYARMINGEKWLKNGITCNMEVVEVKDYDHETFYSLPVSPSPNLPNDCAIRLYPSLCLFEGTHVSVGRGTPFPFQVFGRPDYQHSSLEIDTVFTPTPDPHAAPHPKLEGKQCFGQFLCSSYAESLDRIELKFILDAYQASNRNQKFFNDFFLNLAGTPELQEMIEQGKSEHEIRQSWQEGLAAFKIVRSRYLLYP